LNLQFINVLTDRIIVGNRTGLIQCIRERDLLYPVAHQHFEGAAPAVVPQKPAAAPAGEKPVVDPFADPGDADPFGGDAAPAPKKPEADPFGDDAADPFGGDADPFGGDAEMKKDDSEPAEADPFADS
jgi:hypothetical protein